MILNLSMVFKYKFIKSLIDRFAAFILLFFLLPFLMIISLLIKLNLGRPIFFIQNRPGYKTKSFKLIKFRTMTTEKYKNGKLLNYTKASKSGFHSSPVIVNNMIYTIDKNFRLLVFN